MPTFEENKEVALIIIEQMGGRRALVMIGAENPNKVDVINFGVRIHLPRNATAANRMTITLEPSDTYLVRFSKDSFSKKTYTASSKTIAEYDDVYADSLKQLIERTTGLYLSL